MAKRTLPTPFNDFPTVLDETDVFMIRYADVRELAQVPIGGFSDASHRFTFDKSHPFRFRTSQCSTMPTADRRRSSRLPMRKTVMVSTGSASRTAKASPQATAPPRSRAATTVLRIVHRAATSLAHPLRMQTSTPLDRPIRRALFFVGYGQEGNCPSPPPNCDALAECPILFVVGTDQSAPVAMLTRCR